MSRALRRLEEADLVTTIAGKRRDALYKLASMGRATALLLAGATVYPLRVIPTILGLVCSEPLLDLQPHS